MYAITRTWTPSLSRDRRIAAIIGNLQKCKKKMEMHNMSKNKFYY